VVSLSALAIADARHAAMSRRSPLACYARATTGRLRQSRSPRELPPSHRSSPAYRGLDWRGNGLRAGAAGVPTIEGLAQRMASPLVRRAADRPSAPSARAFQVSGSSSLAWHPDFSDPTRGSGFGDTWGLSVGIISAGKQLARARDRPAFCPAIQLRQPQRPGMTLRPARNVAQIRGFFQRPQETGFA
jgi:hypothetical protein